MPKSNIFKSVVNSASYPFQNTTFHATHFFFSSGISKFTFIGNLLRVWSDLNRFLKYLKIELGYYEDMIS